VNHPFDKKKHLATSGIWQISQKGWGTTLIDPITHLVVWPVLLHFEWNLWRWCLLQPRNRI